MGVLTKGLPPTSRPVGPLPFPGIYKKEKSHQQIASGKLYQATIIGPIWAGRKYALAYPPNVNRERELRARSLCWQQALSMMRSAHRLAAGIKRPVESQDC